MIMICKIFRPVLEFYRSLGPKRPQDPVPEDADPAHPWAMAIHCADGDEWNAGGMTLITAAGRLT